MVSRNNLKAIQRRCDEARIAYAAAWQVIKARYAAKQ